MTEPVTLSFERLLPAPAEVAWAAISDTDLFNRLAGLGFEFEEVELPDGSYKRRGRLRRFGLTLTWDEVPFRYVAPDRFEAERVLESGPVASIRTRFSLSEERDGTRLRYVVELFARSAWLRPLVLVEARLATTPTLARALDAVVRALADPGARFDEAPPLDAAASALLHDRLAPLADRRVAEALEALIARGSLLVQDRIRPLSLAAKLKVSPDDVIRGCLDAVASNALEARLLLLCPSCLGAKDELSRLDPSPRAVHCTTCGIRWEGSLSDDVEVAFRPSPSVRAFEVPVDCVQSPSRTPHVRLQAPLPVGEELVTRVRLPVGSYRLEADGVRGAAHLEVGPGAESRAVVDLTERGMFPRRLELGDGAFELVVRSRVDVRVTISIAERWRPAAVLSLGAFLEHPAGARWAMAHPDLELVPRRGAVVVVLTEPSWGAAADPTLAPALRTRLDALGFAPIDAGDGRIVAFAPRVEQAVGALEAVGGWGRVVALAEGGVTAIRVGPDERLVGPAVDAALATARQAGWGRVAVDSATSESPSFVRALHAVPGVERIEPWGSRPCLLRFAERAPTDAGRGGRPSGRLGPYELGEPVGQGRFGVVFAAQHVDTGESVVLRVVREELSRDPTWSAALWIEQRMAWTVDHPSVARVVDWGCDARRGAVYLAVEPVEGPILGERLREQGALSDESLHALAAALFDAVTALHDAGVLHRDLAPNNVILGPDGPVLVDAGLALRAGAGRRVLEDELRDDSPEQVAGRPLDERADVYQLAWLLTLAGTGVAPVPGRRVADRRRARDENPLEQLPPGLPAGWEGALLRALALEPAERPASVRALRALLLGDQAASTS